MNYTKSFLLLTLSLFFYGCSIPSSTLQNNKLHFNDKKSNKKLLTLNIDKDAKTTQFDKCTIDAYTINTVDKDYGDLFIENIDLKSNCDWDGLGRGQFIYYFKKNMKIDHMKLIKRIDIGNYEFSQYLLDNRCTVNIIYIWGSTKSTFILDKSGKLTNGLLNALGSKDRFTLTSNTCNLIYEKSMVKVNWFEKFFHKEVRGDDQKIFFPLN